MATDRFMIAPLESGLQTNLRPWLIPDEAFAQLNNAYVFRGRVRKRFGSYLLNGSVSPSIAQLYSRLAVKLGTTDVSGDFSGTVPGAIFKIGQMFSVGSNIFTVYQNGALKVVGTGSGTYNTTTGALSITGSSLGEDVYFYPAEPVMGLITYQAPAINDEPVIGFDTQFAYQYLNGHWERLDSEFTLGAAEWSGTDSQFFWGENYRGSVASETFLFVTNFNATDGIRYWDGNTWDYFIPTYNAGMTDAIKTARLIISFKDRLVLLNTIENVSGSDKSFVNRARYCQNGSPIQPDAWREDIAGKGGFIDAPTKEAIITCEILKDRLIVFFENSTWELVYTGNQILPFVWQQINTELGAESTFSHIPFDKVILGVGNVGIHACNGANVDRIDQKIPDEVFDIHNDNEGPLRVYGIRDYFNEMVYWTFPSAENNPTYPNRILVYNYRTGSWAFNDDSITCFGYIQNVNDITWESTNASWEESSEPWNSGVLQGKYRNIIAGNQQGFTFIVSSDSSATRNSPSLQITNITGPNATLTIMNHNLSNNDFVVVENAQGITFSDAATNPDKVYKVFVTGVNTIVLTGITITGTYTGGGTIARVSRIDIKTKQYNFYVKQDRNAYISRVNFQFDKTSNGAVTVDCFTSSSTVSLLDDGAATGTLLGNNVIETSPYLDEVSLEFSQERLWHPIYLQSEGEFVQLRIYLNDDQLRDTSIAWSDFQMHSFIIYAQPTSQRLQ